MSPAPAPAPYRYLFTEENHDASKYRANPYREEDALALLSRNSDDCWEMLEAMEEIHRKYHGPIRLASSPLRSKPWLVAALITTGYIEEVPSSNGACSLKLTDYGLQYLKDH